MIEEGRWGGETGVGERKRRRERKRGRKERKKEKVDEEGRGEGNEGETENTKQTGKKRKTATINGRNTVKMINDSLEIIIINKNRKKRLNEPT